MRAFKIVNFWPVPVSDLGLQTPNAVNLVDPGQSITEGAAPRVSVRLSAGFGARGRRRLFRCPYPLVEDGQHFRVNVFEEPNLDLLVAAGEPEATVLAEATATRLFGTMAPVATLEHLLLMYLYSNQPRHLGDFARIVTDTNVDLGELRRAASPRMRIGNWELIRFSPNLI